MQYLHVEDNEIGFFYPLLCFRGIPQLIDWKPLMRKGKPWKVFLPSILSNIRKQMFVLLFLFLLLIEKDQFRGGLESKYKAIILFIGGFRSKYYAIDFTLLSGGGERVIFKANRTHNFNIAQSMLLIFFSLFIISKVYLKG